MFVQVKYTLYESNDVSNHEAKLEAQCVIALETKLCLCLEEAVLNWYQILTCYFLSYYFFFFLQIKQARIQSYSYNTVRTEEVTFNSSILFANQHMLVNSLHGATSN